MDVWVSCLVGPPPPPHHHLPLCLWTLQLLHTKLHFTGSFWIVWATYEFVSCIIQGSLRECRGVMRWGGGEDCRWDLIYLPKAKRDHFITLRFSSFLTTTKTSCESNFVANNFVAFVLNITAWSLLLYCSGALEAVKLSPVCIIGIIGSGVLFLLGFSVLIAGGNHIGWLGGEHQQLNYSS